MSMRLECVDDEVALTYDDQSVVVGDEMEGFVTFGEEWVNFFFQCTSSGEILRDVQHNMNELYNSNDFPSIVSTPAYCNGSPCAAKYLKDNKWYRARLIDTSYSMVYFVDYGNKQMTNLENVKPLTRSLAELVPPLAYQCKLANFQNPLLPSFVQSDDLINVTILSKTEPYEVSVQVKGRQTGPVANPRAPVDPWTRRGRTANNFEHTPRTNAAGLTLPPLRHARSAAGRLNGAGAPDEGDPVDDEIDQIKGQNRRVRMTNTAGKLAVFGAHGYISELYATCGSVKLEGSYRHLSLQMNSQETTLNNGVIQADNLTRIFRQNDRVTCNARYEDPLPDGMSKISKPPSGYYIVTDMTMDPSNKELVSHAVVTFVSAEGAILYIRNRQQSVYAPESVFPETIKKLANALQLGRSVLVRAMPAEQFPDIQVSSEWVAQSVELLGNVVESQGFMYSVRETYSVVITDGGIGFGYVVVQNQFVDPAGVPQRDWFGSRVLYRACLDVPDKENFRFGVRWKGLIVRLLPEHQKGAYRHAGIFKPSSYGEPSFSAGPSGKKSFDDEGDDNFELPEEALEEMRLMGRDSVGVAQLRDPTKAKSAMSSETMDNLLNEPEDKQLACALALSMAEISAVRNDEQIPRQATPIFVHSTNQQPPVDPATPLSTVDASFLPGRVNGGDFRTMPPSQRSLDDLLCLTSFGSEPLNLPMAALTPSIVGERGARPNDSATPPLMNGHSAVERRVSIDDACAAAAADLMWHPAGGDMATTKPFAVDASVKGHQLNGTTSSASTIFHKPSKTTSAIRTSHSSTDVDELLRLWEGGEPLEAPTLFNQQQRTKAMQPISSENCRPVFKLPTHTHLIDRSKVGKASHGLGPPILPEIQQLTAAQTKSDQPIQADPNLLLEAELEDLRKGGPEAMSKVFHWVITQPADVQQRFYALMARNI